MIRIVLLLSAFCVASCGGSSGNSSVGDDPNKLASSPVNTVIDSDNDSVPDDIDVFPSDPEEAYDLDGDGIGDGTDTDNNNNGIQDIDENIVVYGFENHYTAEDTITVWVMGVARDGQQLSGLEQPGWHVQYYTYKESNPDQYLTSYVRDGFYNAIYVAERNMWKVEFPAYKSAGNFLTQISLYCSRAYGNCINQENAQEQYSLNFSYTLSCPVEGCNDAPDPAPGVQVTNTTDFDHDPTLLRRLNGNLVSVFESNGGAQITTSSDNGITWTNATNLGDGGFPRTYALTENSDGYLFRIGRCLSSEICFYRSPDAVTWELVGSYDWSSLHACGGNCDSNDILAGDILAAGPNFYTISYSYQNDVYVSHSPDLVNWGSPERITASSGDFQWEFDSRLSFHNSLYWLVFVSYTDSAIRIMTSTGSGVWEEHDRIDLNPHLYMNPHLILRDDNLTLFFTQNGTVYTSLVTDAGLTPPAYFDTSLGFGPSFIELNDGSLGSIFSLDLNEQRDIFFKTY